MNHNFAKMLVKVKAAFFALPLTLLSISFVTGCSSHSISNTSVSGTESVSSGTLFQYYQQLATNLSTDAKNMVARQLQSTTPEVFYNQLIDSVSDQPFQIDGVTVSGLRTRLIANHANFLAATKGLRSLADMMGRNDLDSWNLKSSEFKSSFKSLLTSASTMSATLALEDGDDAANHIVNTIQNFTKVVNAFGSCAQAATDTVLKIGGLCHLAEGVGKNIVTAVNNIEQTNQVCKANTQAMALASSQLKPTVGEKPTCIKQPVETSLY